VIDGLRAHGITSRLLVGWATPAGLTLADRMGIDVELYQDGGDQQWQADPGFADWLRPRVAEAELVHAHMFGAWWAAARVVDAGTVLVGSEHNELTWPRGTPVTSLQPGLARLDRFYAHGPGAWRAIVAGGFPPERLRDGISPIGGLDATAREHLPTPRIVFAGRLHPEKGPDLLLSALTQLPNAPPALLLGEGPLRDELLERITAGGIGDRVRLCGWQNGPGSYIAGASVLVVPSREEAWSQTAVLGMALGVPVIGTDVDGLPLTLAGARGIIVPAGDTEALAHAIDAVLAGRRRTDLAAARRYALKFTAARVSAGYARDYRALLSLRRPWQTTRTPDAV